MLITFSGLDGSGKTTLISNLRKSLESQGYQTSFRTMYDDISFYSFLRRARDFFLTLMGKEVSNRQAVMPADEYANIIPQSLKTDVRDKKGALAKCVYYLVRGQMARRISLWFDLLVLIGYRIKEEVVGGRVLITDRYLYDTLIDTLDFNEKKWWFIRFFLLFVPVPTAPVFVDVPAELAYQRKKEYPLEYGIWRRRAYQSLFRMIPQTVIISNDQALDVTVATLTDSVLSRVP